MELKHIYKVVEEQKAAVEKIAEESGLDAIINGKHTLYAVYTPLGEKVQNAVMNVRPERGHVLTVRVTKEVPLKFIAASDFFASFAYKDVDIVVYYK